MRTPSTDTQDIMLVKGRAASRLLIDAYLTGLTAFIDACAHYNPAQNPKAFHSMLNHGLDHFGMTASGVVARTGATKGTVSKWRNSQATPTRPTIEAVRDWMIAQGQQQIETYKKES